MINHGALFLHDILSRSEGLLGIEHVYGPGVVDLTEEDVVVLCVVRNGSPYMKAFLQHYVSLGVRHVVLLDNNSTDDGNEKAMQFDHVTILRSTRPYKYCRYLFKDYLVRRFGRNAWSLCTDIDEFFDFPLSKKISLKALVAYLNRYAYTAVVCQLLDRFPLEVNEGDNRIFTPEDYPFYDTTDVRKENYPRGKGCVISNPAIRSHWGGARGRRFSLPDICLTKNSLLKTCGKTRRDNNNHWVVNARIADFSAVLMHYKFTPWFFDLGRNAIREKQYYRRSFEYHAYMQEVEDSRLEFRNVCASSFCNVQELLESGFLEISDQYRGWSV